MNPFHFMTRRESRNRNTAPLRNNVAPFVLHVGFGLLAALLVVRVVAASITADERRAKADAEVSEILENWAPLGSGDGNDAADGTLQTSEEPASIAALLNCSSIDGFAVALPAQRGFVCSSLGRAAHPITVFVYDAGVAETVRQDRTTRACEKARLAGRPAAFVLTTDDLFVWTTSPSAVEASGVSEQFIKLDSRTCS